MIFINKIKTAIKVYKQDGITGLKAALNHRYVPGCSLKKTYDSSTLKLEWEKRKEFYLSPLAFGCQKEVYDQQKSAKFNKIIKFSILVPLYNTPENFLKEMIGSVLFQSYSNWELCLADGSDDNHNYVGDICREIAKTDSRIKYKKLEKNGGISENTNECIKLATGDFISLFDHDDLLHPSALYETMVAICENNADFVYTDEATFESPDLAKIIHTNFKPDFSPDLLNGHNYICHFTSFNKSLLEKIDGKFNKEFDGAQDFDLILRLTEVTDKIVHIKKCLYYWRASPASTAGSAGAKSYTTIAGQKALVEHFKRLNISAEVIKGRVPNTYRIKYEISKNPLVSILIPNYEHWKTLKRCMDSILSITTYSNYEILIIENNSKSKETFEYYEELEKNPKIKVITWKDKFNYSAINNYGFSYAKGEHIILLNNDIEVITPDWIQEMLMFSQQKEIGCVGAMLYYPSNKIQHAGLILGIGGVASHSHKYFARNDYGYNSRLCMAQNVIGNTAACVMIKSSIYKELNGLDESFEVAFNDVDFCMRIHKAGYHNIWTPFAELYHYESESRGAEDTPEKVARFNGEVKRFQTRWEKELLDGDPYYNPNLTLDSEDFSVNDGAVFYGFECDKTELPECPIIELPSNSNVLSIDMINNISSQVAVNPYCSNLLLGGWAANIEKHDSFSKMYIKANEKCFEFSFNVQRPDVAKILNIKEKAVGFNVSVPMKFLKLNGKINKILDFYFFDKSESMLYHVPYEINFEKE